MFVFPCRIRAAYRPLFYIFILGSVSFMSTASWGLEDSNNFGKMFGYVLYSGPLISMFEKKFQRFSKVGFRGSREIKSFFSPLDEKCFGRNALGRLFPVSLTSARNKNGAIGTREMYGTSEFRGKYSFCQTLPVMNCFE